MEKLIRMGRAFYGLGIIGIGLQQFVYSGFRPMLLAYWSPRIPGLRTCAYIAGAILILAGVAIILLKNARKVSLILGLFFFLLFLFSHVYYLLFLNPYDFHIGSWTNALKELAFSGCSLIVAASYPEEKPMIRNSVLLPLGRVFFSLMLIVFGVDHFVYTEFVATLVPDWIPGHIFWTYVGAVALIGAGACILLKIKIQLVALLLGIMLFTWFVILHIPRAIAAPATDEGNELTSVFQALAFSGIAFVIVAIYKKNRREIKVL